MKLQSATQRRSFIDAAAGTTKELQWHFQIPLTGISDRSRQISTVVLLLPFIAFGIMALIGIITAIDAMGSSRGMVSLPYGHNGFTIAYKERIRLVASNQTEDQRKKLKSRTLTKPIQLHWSGDVYGPCQLLLSIAERTGITKFVQKQKTNQCQWSGGGDRNYLLSMGSKVATGRNFISSMLTSQNVYFTRYFIGAYHAFFGSGAEQRAGNKMVNIGGIPAILDGGETKGSSAALLHCW